MSSARLINEGEARALCQRETGHVFKRGELVHYSHDQLLSVKGTFDDSFIIYGTLVVNSFQSIRSGQYRLLRRSDYPFIRLRFRGTSPEREQR